MTITLGQSISRANGASGTLPLRSCSNSYVSRALTCFLQTHPRTKEIPILR